YANWRKVRARRWRHTSQFCRGSRPLAFREMATGQILADNVFQGISVDLRYEAHEIALTVGAVVLLDQPSRQARPITVAAVEDGTTQHHDPLADVVFLYIGYQLIEVLAFGEREQFSEWVIRQRHR